MKKFLTVIMLVMLSIMLIPVNVYADLDIEKKVISSQESAILVNVGEVINLNDYVYRHQGDEDIPLSEVTLTLFSSGLNKDGFNISATYAGTHSFLLQYQSTNMYVYLIAKAALDTEYVLFEENFDSYPNGKLPNGFSSIGGAGILDNKLLVSGKGGNAIVTLPSYLRSFSNYIIETDFTIIEEDNNSRWASVMFRYKEEHYYQMAIRKEATLSNGVEFAKRVSGQWNVTNTSSFSEVINSSKMYRLKLDVMDTNVKEYINDQLMITYEQAIEYKKGLIGVQATGANALFDNFKITLPLEYIREDTFEFTQIPNVYNPSTKIVNPATVLTKINSISQLESYKGNQRPQTGILSVDQDLNVISESGTVITTLYNALIQMNGNMIPGIKIDDVTTADIVSKRLKVWGIVDLFIISSNPEVLLKAIENHPLMRGVLDLSQDTKALTKERLLQIRNLTNETKSVAVVLNENLITKEIVNYLQQRLITVWTTSNSDTLTSHYRAILSGVNGIVTDYYESIFTIYEAVQTISHVREVFLIAHRGLHNGYTASMGPENSVEVALKAVENGAKIVEIDVHLTSDNDVVVMHDNTTNRTATVPAVVANQPLDLLTSIPLIDISNTGNTFNIPSYRTFLETFKDSDVVLFVEIKPTNKELLKRTQEITAELEMEDQIVFIMFSAQNALDLTDVMPSISKGYLTGALITSNLSQTLLSVLTSVVPMKTTLNPSYTPVTGELTNALTHRGITIWPWTVDDINSMNYLYNAGVGGITTNNSDHYLDQYLYLKFDKTNFEITTEEIDFRVEGYIEKLNGETYPYRGQIIIVENTANAVFDQTGKLISYDGKGTVKFYTVVSSTLPRGAGINIYSDLMTLNIVDPQPTIFQNPVFYIVLGSLVLISSGLTFVLIYNKNKRRV